MSVAPKFNTNDPEAVEIRRKVAAIDMELYDVTTLEAVRKFEAEASVKLPDDYVWFITNVGNGGTWHTKSKYPFFPLTTVEEAWFASPDLDENKDEKYSLGVLHRGCTYCFGIILKGEYYGEISDNAEQDAYFKPNENRVHNFKELYTAWLEEAYAGYDEYGFERRHGGTVEELFRKYRNSGDVDYLGSIYSKINKKTATKEFMAKLRAEFSSETDNDKKVGLCGILIKSGYDDPLSLFKKIFRPENYEVIIWHFIDTLECIRNISNNKPEYYPMFVEMLKYMNTLPEFDTYYFDRCLEMVIKNPEYKEDDIIDVLTTDNKLAVERISYSRSTLREVIGKYIDLAVEKRKKME